MKQPQPVFIYLHGFNSSGQSAKADYFAKHFRYNRFVRPSYPPEPAAAMKMLQQLIAKECEASASCILIGASLGGYYVQYLARQYGLPAILINPALEPVKTLLPYTGWLENFYTGDRYFFGEEHLQQLARFDIPAPCQNPVPTQLLLDSGDELIDPHIALARYRDCANITVYPDGNHQFVHLAEAVTVIQSFADSIMKKCDINHKK